ncbi:hypothetical protein ACQB60_15105 [Actinomycetota bacterium Odt1-20B]
MTRTSPARETGFLPAHDTGHTPYVGSGPYCYAHSLAMMLGPDAPPPAVVETLTGSAFGVGLVGGTLPFFDPYGWDPEVGLDDAVDLLGWTCARVSGGTHEEAQDRLRASCAEGPVLVGPVDMGLLLHQPGTPAAYGGSGDHYVVALAVEGDTVLFHDPHGHPYATLPLREFVVAWRAESVPYTDTPYVQRTRFARRREVTDEQALRASLPGAAAWLAGRTDRPMPAGSLGGAAALEELAAWVDRGLDPGVRAHLAHFAIRLGARRLGDAADCLARLSLGEASAAASWLARGIGALQYPVVTGDDRVTSAALRELAPGYERLRRALSEC